MACDGAGHVTVRGPDIRNSRKISEISDCIGGALNELSCPFSVRSGESDGSTAKTGRNTPSAMLAGPAQTPERSLRESTCDSSLREPSPSSAVPCSRGSKTRSVTARPCPEGDSNPPSPDSPACPAGGSTSRENRLRGHCFRIQVYCHPSQTSPFPPGPKW